MFLFSCSHEKEEDIRESSKYTEHGVTDPFDPDMHNTCGDVNSMYDYLQDPTVMYSKNYLLINNTSDTIRVNAYILPKFANTVPNLNIPTYDFMIQEMLIPPGTCYRGLIGYVMEVGNNPLGHVGPREIWDHTFGPFQANGDPSEHFWNKYPSMIDYTSIVKVPFLEFWIMDSSNPGANHHLIALEDVNSYLLNVSTSSGPKMDFDLPFAFPIGGVKYYLLPNELVSLGYGSANCTAYYFLSGITNTAKDLSYNIRGTYRYMPNVVSTSYPHTNPDITPGYIIKFEDF